MSKENNMENEITNYVFVKDGRKHFIPQYISPNTTTTKWIFSIPEPNAVGTLDKQSNSIIFMKFVEYGKNPECKIIAQNCGRSILDCFRYRFSPNYTDDMIIFARTEDVVLTNIKDGEAFCATRSLPESSIVIKNGEILYVDNGLPETINVELFCVDDETFDHVPVPADGKCVYPATLTTYIDGMRVYTNVELGIEDDDLPKDPCYIKAVSFLNSQNKLFMVVNTLSALNEGNDELTDFLQVVKLEDNYLINTSWIMHLGRLGKESDGGLLLHQTWFVHNQKLFAYDPVKHQMLCTDGNLPILHPFVEIFNNGSNNIGTIKDLALHPKLPFGIMIEENILKKQCLILLRWDVIDYKKQNRDKQIIFYNQILQSLATLWGLDCLEFGYHSFSPDGNWYVVGCIDPRKYLHPHFIAIPIIPVDKKHQDFLDIGNLIVLGQVIGISSIAWTFEPTSYVVSDGELLHKWDLDELPNARVFVVPGDNDEQKKVSIFRKITRLFKNFVRLLGFVK